MILRILIILALAGTIFGGAYLAVYELYIQPEVELKTDKQAPRPEPPVDPSIADFKDCLDVRNTKSPVEAVAAMERFLQVNPASSKRDEARAIIGELNSALFFSAKPTEENTVLVKRGDSLARISSHTKMSVELIVYLNKLQNDNIHPGQRLLAFPTDFRLSLKQREQKVVLMRDGKFFRQYSAVSWPGKKPPVILPKQTARVVEKTALTEKGIPPKPTSQEYFGAFHTIGFPIPGHSLFSHSGDTSRPVPGGIELALSDMSEIAVLLPKGAQVTLE